MNERDQREEKIPRGEKADQSDIYIIETDEVNHPGPKDTSQTGMAPELSVSHLVQEDIQKNIALEDVLGRLVQEDGVMILDTTPVLSRGTNRLTNIDNERLPHL